MGPTRAAARADRRARARRQLRRCGSPTRRAHAVDLALGLPADGLLRAPGRRTRRGTGCSDRRAAGRARGGAARSGRARAALEAATLAIERARPESAPGSSTGAAGRRRGTRKLGRLADARVLLDAARGGGARIGESAIAGLALAELGWIDLAEQRPAAAAVCLEFAAEFLRRATHTSTALEADALAVVCWVEAGDLPTATDRAPKVADAARAQKRPDLIAFLDGAMADLALRRARPGTAAAPDAREAALQACALAAESALGLPDTQLARDLIAQSRLRQVRASDDPLDRERHLEAGIEVALTLDRQRAGARLGSALVGLLDDAVTWPPTRDELHRLGTALTNLGDPELAQMARGVLAEL
ncbi:MAG: hypothetical protein WKG01_21420 [Kofleriaceae bacterium]